jgi:hypothetical protein
MVRSALPAALVLLLTASGWAQISSKAQPIYHGMLILPVRLPHRPCPPPAFGTIDRTSGNATLKVTHSWRLLLDPEQSNGIYPDQEPIIVALNNDTFFLAAGSLKASRDGKTFSYRAHLKRGDRGIQSISIRRMQEGAYGVRFTLFGTELSSLIFSDPQCLPMAVIIGDDDGFTGIDITTAPRYRSKLRVPQDCDQQSNWPWT